MSKQTKMLKQDILKILAKDVSGGSNTRPPFEDAKRPNTFFGGKDNQPYYPLAQEPSPAANPATPIVPGRQHRNDPHSKTQKPHKRFLVAARSVRKQKQMPKKFVLKKRKIGSHVRPPHIISL